MKCNFLVFMFISFVLNVCCGQFIGDPAPGRSPGPPGESNPILTDYTTTITATSHHVHSKYTKQPLNPFKTPITTTTNTSDSRNTENRPNEASTNEPFMGSRHREHNIKSHGSSAVTHHVQSDRVGKSSSKTGAYFKQKQNEIKKRRFSNRLFAFLF